MKIHTDIWLVFVLFIGNVYRGCGRKRCAVSHTIGTFSSSVCCQTDYCNESTKNFFSKTFLMINILLVLVYQRFIWFIIGIKNKTKNKIIDVCLDTPIL